MKVTATELRQNLYRIIAAVLETGEAVEVARKGGIWDGEPELDTPDRGRA